MRCYLLRLISSKFANEQAAQLAQIPTEAILWFIYENDMGLEDLQPVTKMVYLLLFLI